MAKPFDISKFRRSITKAVPGLSVGFNDPDTWISTGNYTLNKLISGDFTKGIPLGKVTVLAGESGAGKSYIASGNIVRHAQQQGIFVILIDSENALDEAWLKALDVDTSEDKLLKLNMSMIDDVARTISDFMKDYKAEYADKTSEERPKVLFVVDSLGMLLTPTDVNQFQAGDMKGDMGRKPKALTSLVRNTVNMFGEYNVGLIATNHTYASQDMFDPDDKISGGQGFIYASSIVIAMRKLKLKTDADGNKTTTVNGIRAACKVMKTRYAKPFESVQVEIPYETGMSPYSGLVEFFEAKGLLKKSGNSLEYTSSITGEVIKMFRKPWNANKDGALDTIMEEFDLTQEKENIVEAELNNDEDEDYTGQSVFEDVNTSDDDVVVVAH
jgi:RecA/RadA recombinase